MSRNGAIRKYLTKKELEDALNPSNYLGSSDKIVENAVRICRG